MVRIGPDGDTVTTGCARSEERGARSAAVSASAAVSGRGTAITESVRVRAAEREAVATDVGDDVAPAQGARGDLQRGRRARARGDGDPAAAHGAHRAADAEERRRVDAHEGAGAPEVGDPRAA